jgi:hypothetical protein
LSRKCPRCKQWTDVELFSHGICPACNLAVYGKITEKQERRLKQIKKETVTIHSYKVQDTNLNISNIERLLKIVRSPH